MFSSIDSAQIRKPRTSLLSITKFRETPEVSHQALASALDVLRAQRGFVRGWIARAADDAELLVLVTEWDGVGAYRRALSAAEVKLAGAPVWLYALDEPGAYVPGEQAVEG